MKLLKKIDWAVVAVGFCVGMLMYFLYYMITYRPPVDPPVAGTLVCHADGQMTAALQTSDGLYLGNGTWGLLHDKSKLYTRYVKANNEACVFVPGESITTPQPPAPPKTTAEVPRTKGSNAS